VSRSAVSPDTLPEVMTLAEAAQLLRFSDSVLADRAGRGEVPGEFLGEWRFRKSRLLALLDAPAELRKERKNEVAVVRPIRGRKVKGAA